MGVKDMEKLHTLTLLSPPSTHTYTTHTLHWTNEEKGYLLPTIAENNLPMFQLNAPVVIRAKVKEVQTNTTLFIAKHY